MAPFGTVRKGFGLPGRVPLFLMFLSPGFGEDATGGTVR